MQLSANPFRAGNPVPPEQFVGMADLCQTLFSRIYNGEFVNVVGGPKTGKTSLLRYTISEEGFALRNRGAGHRTLFLMHDCQALTQSFTPVNLWRETVEFIEEALDREDLRRQIERVKQNNYGTTTLQRLFTLLSHHQHRLTLVLDEAEALLNNPNFSTAEFLGGLRSLSSTSGGLSLVFASHRTIKELIELGRAITGSPPFNHGVDLSMRALSGSELRELLSQQLQVSNLRFGEPEQRYIQDFSGGHPYLAQVTAATLFDRLAVDGRAGIDLRQTGEQVLDRTAHFFDELWGRSSLTARAVIQATARAAFDRRSSGPEPEVRPEHHELVALEREGFLMKRVTASGEARWAMRAFGLALWARATNKLQDRSVLRPVLNAPAEREEPEAALHVKLEFVTQGRGKAAPTRPGRATIIWKSEYEEKESQFTSPFPATALPAVIKALDATHYPGYPNNTFAPQFSDTEQELLQQQGLWADGRVREDIHTIIGRRLYEALIRDPSGKEVLRNVLNVAKRHGRPIRYTLHFPARAFDLTALPWEALVYPERDVPLIFVRGDSTRVDSIERFIDYHEPIPKRVAGGQKLRVLAICPGYGLDEHVRREELRQRLESWKSLQEQGLLQWEELVPATTVRLQSYLENNPRPDVVHFYGHGALKHSGVLYFDHRDGAGEGEEVSAVKLASVLGGLKLIVLFACQSAMGRTAGAPEGPITGLAHALSAVSEAVIGMQFTVGIEAAYKFSGKLYAGLARGHSVQRAVAGARADLHLFGDAPSWYVPTLYVRTEQMDELYLIRR